mmetsp:Transcript_11006/g.19415  ORF Transcript_11006/g.19415 Transcript_11006/m.19415 type:complete len:370 (-) Transcript_11006:585-1694(-)
MQEEFGHQESNQTQNGVRHGKEGLRTADEVDQSGNLADGVDLVGSAPQTTMHGVELEQLQGILDPLGRAVSRVRHAGLVGDIGDEHSCHKRVGGVLHEDLVRLEVRHARISPAEGLIAHHRERRSGRGNVRGHCVVVVVRDNRTPVLQALRQRVVGALRNTQTVDELHLAAVRGGDRRQGVLDQAGAQGQQVKQDLNGLTNVETIVLQRGIVRLIRNEVDVRRSAQEGNRGVRAGLAHLTDDRVGRERKLHVQVTVQVGVVADRQALLGGHDLQPRSNFSRLLGEVAATASKHVCIGGIGILRLSKGENDGTGGVASGGDQTLPHLRRTSSPCTGDINRHHGSTVLEQLDERAHGRASTDENKVLAGKI